MCRTLMDIPSCQFWENVTVSEEREEDDDDEKAAITYREKNKNEEG